MVQRHHRSLVVLIVLTVLAAPAVFGAVSDRERTALLDLYNATNGAQWTDHTGWNGAAGTECQWYGVVCDDAQATIIRLELGVNNLAGTVPASIGDFGNLLELYLPENKLTGTIPDSIGRLSKLTLFMIQENAISGSIPASLGSMSSLTDLEMNNNQLTGAIPPELGSLSNLQYLRLSTNKLTGAIPAAFGQLRSLQMADLSDNQLSGSIPRELAGATQLNELILAANNLTGEIPVELYSLSNLQALNLEQNKIGGTLPADIARLQNLRQLTLYGNQLGGPLPAQITSMPQMERLELGANQFSGSIPPDIDRLTKLDTLDLGDNAMTGGLPAAITTLRNLRVLSLYDNQLTGTIPPQIGSMTTLQFVNLANNQFTGSMPDLRALTGLEELYMGTNLLGGSVPDMFAPLTKLRVLVMDNNLFTGSLPPSLTSATALEYIDFSYNQLTGSVPADISRLTNLQYLMLSYNAITGQIPDSIWDMQQLIDLRLGDLQLEGTLPSRIANLQKLEVLTLNGNSMSGVIPPEIGHLASLQYLSLGGNRFSGAIPRELGSLAKLIQLDLYGNALSGTIPPELMNLTSLADGESTIQYNALYTSDESVRAFMNRKQYDNRWEDTQTVTPLNVRVTATTDRSATIEWTPISYQWDEGGYQVRASLSAGGSDPSITTTCSKEIGSAVIRGLRASTTYNITVVAVTYPHDDQHNVLVSEASQTVQAVTGSPVLAPPEVIVTGEARGLVQIDGVPQNEDSFALTNFGDAQTVLTLYKFDCDWCTISPETFTLAAGATQTITVKSVPNQKVGTYWGWVEPSGTGVAADLGVSISLLSATRPAGSVIAEPVSARVEITGVPGSDSVGTVRFRNNGTATLTGLAISDVPWIVPRTDPVTIDPQNSGTVTFSVLRSKRPASTGAFTGTITLIYVAGTNAAELLHASGTSTPYSVSIVTVVDTAKPQVAPGTLPPIGTGEVAYFIPGLAAMERSFGTIVSDVALQNSFGSKPIDDLRLYFTPSASTQTVQASVASIAGNQSVMLANVVTNVYASPNPIGSLQVRSGQWQKLVVAARLLTVGKSGNYCGDLPVFRSDRSIAAGAQMDLVGLRSTSAMHTTIYLQETSSAAANAHIDFLDANGTTAGSRNDALAPFGLTEITDIPAAAVTAIVTNQSGSAGRITAYARIIDDSAGDSWSVVDWSRYYGFLQTEPARLLMAQSSGSSGGKRRAVPHGDLAPAPNATTRTATELMLFNPAATDARVRIRYTSSAGTYDKEATIASHRTLSVSDVMSYVGAPASTAGGYVLITPERGSVAATGHITSSGARGSYGTSVPIVPAQSGLRVGQSQIFSSLEDSTAATVGAAITGTYRTSYGFIETAGAPATVVVSLLLSDGRSLVSTVVSRKFDIAAGQLVVVPDLVHSIIGDDRERYPDLHNLQLQVDVTGGSGAVVPFVMMVDNATGDSLLRLE